MKKPKLTYSAKEVFDRFNKIGYSDRDFLDKGEAIAIIIKIRNKNCELYHDGCEGSAGCCDSCATAEEIIKELDGEKI